MGARGGGGRGSAIVQGAQDVERGGKGDKGDRIINAGSAGTPTAAGGKAGKGKGAFAGAHAGPPPANRGGGTSQCSALFAAVGTVF